MIPHLVEHIGRRVKVLQDISNESVYATQPSRIRRIAKGEIVTVLDIKDAPQRLDAGEGFKRVFVQPTDMPQRAFYTAAHTLELVPESVSAPYDARTVEILARLGGDPRAAWSALTGVDVHAQKLSEAHTKVADAYTALAYALNDLKALEKGIS